MQRKFSFYGYVRYLFSQFKPLAMFPALWYNPKEKYRPAIERKEKMKKLKLPILLAIVLVVLCIVAVLLTKTGPNSSDPTNPPTNAPTSAPTNAPTDAPTEAPTNAPTEAPIDPTDPPEVLFRNPLNGQPMEEAYTGRVFGVSINNSKSALPFHGISQADVFFEMYVNEYATRGFALFSDMAAVNSVGSVRSHRYNFTDLATAYDLIAINSGGYSTVLEDADGRKIDMMNCDDNNGGYRDYDRYKNQGYAWEHCLFAVGEDLIKAAKKKGFDLELAGKDYGMLFTDEATPADGEDASEIEIVLTIGSHKKSSIMKYNENTGKYVFWQYNKKMIDENNGQDIAFTNVIVMFAKNTNEGIYHIAELDGSGEGYFACGGKIVPIRWVHENQTDAFTFFLADGTPLQQGVGSTYIAIAPIGSEVNY